MAGDMRSPISEWKGKKVYRERSAEIAGGRKDRSEIFFIFFLILFPKFLIPVLNPRIVRKIFVLRNDCSETRQNKAKLV
jgi:hypothetical protein